MDYVPIELIEEDDMILCFKDGQTRFMEALICQKHPGFDGDIIEIVMENDQTILVTPDHTMLVGE